MITAGQLVAHALWSLLMWALAVEAFSAVTVKAEDLESFWKVISDQPRGNGCPAAPDLAAMCVPVPVDMVNRQKQGFGYPTAGAFVSIVFQYKPFRLIPVAFSEKPAPVPVLFTPFPGPSSVFRFIFRVIHALAVGRNATITAWLTSRHAVNRRATPTLIAKSCFFGLLVGRHVQSFLHKSQKRTFVSVSPSTLSPRSIRDSVPCETPISLATSRIPLSPIKRHFLIISPSRIVCLLRRWIISQTTAEGIC